jgi:hypothetical protein
MPAPQATVMQNFARLKFTSFALKVPTNWQDPQGDPQAKHYSDAFKPSDKATAPGSPPLFLPATMNKYHTDSQKMHIAKIGAFIDKTCSAICSAWSTWQSSTTMVGVMIMGPIATMGSLVGPPMTPLILGQGAVNTPSEMKFTNVIANVIGTAWQQFTATVMIPGLPFYPAYAASPTPVAVPVPNIPFPFAALTQVPVSISAQIMKMQMIAQLGDPQAPFAKELFESIATAFEQCYDLWKVSTMVNNVLPGPCPVPSWTPLSPVGPVVGGMATMLPGGLT